MLWWYKILSSILIYMIKTKPRKEKMRRLIDPNGVVKWILAEKQVVFVVSHVTNIPKCLGVFTTMGEAQRVAQDACPKNTDTNFTVVTEHVIQ